MWKQSLSFWEAVSWYASIIALLAGGIGATSVWFAQAIIGILAWLIAVISGFISWYASKTASDIVQREADEKIAAAKRKAVEANEKAEQERLERVRIEARLAPRSLSQPQLLSDKLKRFEGTVITIFRPSESGQDAVRLQGQVASALKTAGWIINTIVMNTPPGRYFEGVVIITSREAEDEILDAANLLVNELKADGIITTRGFRDTDPPDEINMIIGTKP